MKLSAEKKVEAVDPNTGEFLQMDLEDFLRESFPDPGLGKPVMLDDGRELGNPVPHDPPIGYRKQPSMVDLMRDMIRSESLRVAAEGSGMETFDEADDFEVGDDFDPTSPYESEFEPLDVLRRREADYRKAEEERLKGGSMSEERPAPVEPRQARRGGSKSAPKDIDRGSPSPEGEGGRGDGGEDSR